MFKKCFAIYVCITINSCRRNIMKCNKLNNTDHHKDRRIQLNGMEDYRIDEPFLFLLLILNTATKIASNL